MAEPVEGQPTGDSPCVSSDVTSENAHKKMKISVSEQAFDSAIKEFMEKEHPATTEWSIVKDRKSVSSRRHRDEEINKRRNISTYSHEGVSEDAMDIELSNATNSNDNRPRDFLINHAAPGNKSKNSNNDDKAKSVPRDNIKDNVASDILSRDTIEPSAPSDTQHNREIYTVIGTHLKKCTQHVQTTIASARRLIEEESRSSTFSRDMVVNRENWPNLCPIVNTSYSEVVKRDGPSERDRLSGPTVTAWSGGAATHRHRHIDYTKLRRPRGDGPPSNYYRQLICVLEKLIRKGGVLHW
ncbi:uncharacterized protein LOC118644312 isoform X3 [Monomorium pharaonis]|uniref:uncharacterized protein LOC118644312 isoform X3 n=1 Tax=Monomorium pharaonis TaxID=307658 RepID=UPI001746B532|nr:uncharacterized protein LOC118644312 isoform X3 [Monomorium pharaonis]